MSLFYDNENYELSTSIEVDTLLAELPFALLKESIIEQITDPVSVQLSYIDVIVDKCNVFKEMYGEDKDLVTEVDRNLEDFFVFIISSINDRFELGLDIEAISAHCDVIDVGSALYTYFILRYVKNISKFISKFILNNKKSISDNFSDVSKKDITTLAFKKTIKNRDDLVILTNLPSIIKYIINLNVDMKEFIQLSTGSDNYEASVIVKLIDDDMMTGNLIKYIGVSVDDHDYILDEIQTSIKTKIIKKIS